MRASNKSDKWNNLSKLIKQPSINLKGFGGEPRNCQTFYDNFECVLHHSNDLSDIRKMIYLEKLKEGQSSDVTARLKLSQENYVMSLNLF